MKFSKKTFCELICELPGAAQEFTAISTTIPMLKRTEEEEEDSSLTPVSSVWAGVAALTVWSVSCISWIYEEPPASSEAEGAGNFNYHYEHSHFGHRRLQGDIGKKASTQGDMGVDVESDGAIALIEEEKQIRILSEHPDQDRAPEFPDIKEEVSGEEGEDSEDQGDIEEEEASSSPGDDSKGSDLDWWESWTRGNAMPLEHQYYSDDSVSEDTDHCVESEETIGTNMGQHDQFYANVSSMSSIRSKQFLLTLAHDPTLIDALSAGLQRFEAEQAVDMKKIQKDSQDRAEENIAKVLNTMEDIERSGSKFEGSKFETKCFEEVREKLVWQSTPLAMAAVQAHRILRPWLLKNKAFLNEDQKKVGHYILDAVMLLCRAECSEATDRKEFLQVAAVAHGGELDRQDRAQLLSSYHKDSFNKKNGFMSNSCILTLQRGTKRRRWKSNEKREEMEAEGEEQEKPPPGPGVSSGAEEKREEMEEEVLEEEEEKPPPGVSSGAEEQMSSGNFQKDRSPAQKNSTPSLPVNEEQQWYYPCTQYSGSGESGESASSKLEDEEGKKEGEVLAEEAEVLEGKKNIFLVQKKTKKLFLGGISHATTTEHLHHHFSKIGKVIECIVKFTQEGRSRRFGFVTLDRAAARKCLVETQIIDGCTIEVKEALPPWNPKLNSSQNSGISPWTHARLGLHSGWNSGQNSMGSESDMWGSQWFNNEDYKFMSWTRGALVIPITYFFNELKEAEECWVDSR